MRFHLKRIFNSSKEYILLALLLVISVTLLPLNSNEKIQPVKKLAFGSFAFVTSILAQPLNLLDDLDELELQRKLNAELMLENSLLKSNATQLDKLANLLEYKDSVNAPLKAAKIISRFGSAFNGRFIINIGLSDSIKSGMPVITEKGLVGIVEFSTDQFSVVNNLFNNELSFAVTVSETNTDGIINWNGVKLIIDNIPTTTLVKPGYTVLTSDFSTIFPPKIPVGKVAATETTIAGLLSKIEVQPFENIESVTSVFVVHLDQNPELQSVKEKF